MSSERISYLFVPADSERKLIKAFDSAADALILDLEDGVAPASKAKTREILRSALGQWSGAKRNGKYIIVRCNPVGSSFFDDDMVLLKTLELDALMLPKCEDESAIRTVMDILPDREILPLIESARGVVRLERMVGVGGNIKRVAFGAVDFALDLGVDWTVEGAERRHAQGQLVLLSRALGLEAPVGPVFPTLDDQTAFESEARQEKELGFFGKMTIHPRQTNWLNGIYQISSEQQEWSRRVVVAFEGSGSGVSELDGKLIDRPVYENARRVLQRVGKTK